MLALLNSSSVIALHSALLKIKMQRLVHQRAFANKGSEQVLVYTTQHPEGEPKAFTRRLNPNSTRMIML